MEEYIYYNNLYDCYRDLLTDKQKNYFEEYYFNNLSLSEISENYQVSRNAVYKQLQIAKEKLEEYEKKLKLLEKKKELEDISNKVKDQNIRKRIQKLFFVVIFFFVFSIFNVNAKSSIDNIDITVDIDKNGTAFITEIWDLYVDEGTELYKTYGNMETYPIKNFKVKENNRVYQAQKNWNSNQSFNKKKYKNGIAEKGNKKELCWGISEYGNKKYILTYEIENIVKQYNDSQVMYFSFMPTNMEPSPNKVNLNIQSQYIKFDNENSVLKAYGYIGNINYNNGIIQMTTTEPLSQDRYITALIKINNNPFILTDHINKDFSDVKKEADSTINDSNTNINQQSINYSIVIAKIFKVIMTIITIILLSRYMLKKKRLQNIKKVNMNHSIDSDDMESISYHREIPFAGDLEKIYWVCCYYNLIEDEGSIIGAYLLKWLNENRIQMKEENQRIYIDFSNIGTFEKPLEEKLKNIFLSASSRDYILESFEFKEWCKDQYQQIISWLESYRYEGKQKLIELGYIDKQTIQLNNNNGQKITKTKTIPTEKIKEPMENMVGLKKFLLDFSIIDERQSIEVAAWNQYLIIAYILGIANEVSSEFKKVYPKYQFIENLDLNKMLETSYNYGRDAYEFSVKQYNEGKEGKSYMPSEGKSDSGSFNVSSSGGTSSGGFSSGGGIR